MALQPPSVVVRGLRITIDVITLLIGVSLLLTGVPVALFSVVPPIHVGLGILGLSLIFGSVCIVGRSLATLRFDLRRGQQIASSAQLRFKRSKLFSAAQFLLASTCAVLLIAAALADRALSGQDAILGIVAVLYFIWGIRSYRNLNTGHVDVTFDDVGFRDQNLTDQLVRWDQIRTIRLYSRFLTEIVHLELNHDWPHAKTERPQSLIYWFAHSVRSALDPSRSYLTADLSDLAVSPWRVVSEMKAFHASTVTSA